MAFDMQPANPVLHPSPPRHPRRVAFVAACLVVVVSVTLGELLVRWIAPQRSLYPRTAFSTDYGFMPYPDTEMVNEVPGRWRFVYRTNTQGHRGPLLPISNRYPRPSVVVLGDSYTFGVGVDDGQEYAEPLRQALAGRYDVVNLGVEGWGLTQEIRRFYELGQLYQPAVVVVQFCSNDPSDNLLSPVTLIQDGRFVFQPSLHGLATIKRYLSRSWLQKSQIYNLARDVGYNFWRQQEVRAQMREDPVSPAAVSTQALSSPPADEAHHMRLLALFAEDLQRRGIRLVMFAVDGQLERFPALRGQVQALHQQGRLEYVELMDWFPDGKIDKSPEGHWAPTVHQVVARHLAETIIQGPGAESVRAEASK